ncbi:tripartite motif-containing protein 16-like [Hypomesus transpacificus]|uniref:tripartite motif-containing protein 16-like n=1 Tax=Hypomesus transpacificus TaxID=137520 RepID=UPI001F07D2D2|nr:tripartite motif-containing protein 16-like [Hypomesus transpacificus]
MAQQGVVLDQDQFCCSVCLDLLKDPVTLACGHSYCSSCIEGYWDQDEQKGVYSCPQCRQSFTLRPTLKRNNMLAEVVEKLNETGGAQVAPSELTNPAGPGEVTCDLCTGPRKQRALKSCLVCMVSYCQTHLQPHYQVPGLKKHKLVEATSGLQEMICSSHDKLLEVFCRTDQQCICMLCTMEEHKGHDTVSAKAERKEKQDKLVLSQQEVQQRVQQREKELKELQQAVESLKVSGQAAEKDIERIFTELIRSIERRRSEVKDLSRAQQGAAVSQAKGLLKRLEQEIAELRRRDAELEKLSHTEDNIHFLQNYQSLSNTSVSSDGPSISVPPLQYFKHVTEVVSELRDKLEELIQREWSNISTTVSTMDVFLPPEPKTRADLLPYSCQLTLDPNTTYTRLSLSEENRKVTYLMQQQPYPVHPERFTVYSQVLCKEALSGRCYWEVERRGGRVETAVSYKDIIRTDGHSGFGNSDKSWRLRCSSGGYTFRHNRVDAAVSGPQSSRVGMYLDHKAGTLSFYSVVSDTVTLLHRVQTTFTQPLYPGFGLVNHGDSAEILKLW